MTFSLFPGPKNYSWRRSSGFTIIELLVVIAIIGILASIVLATLVSGRNKGSDATIKGDIAGTRTQAEGVFNLAVPNSYAALCGDTTIASQLRSAAALDGATIDNTLTDVGGTSKITCHASAAAYAIQAPLVSNSNNSQCVDSQGDSKLETGTGNYLAASATVCP
jgi:prepilin-type N-terminal cleavage/methylation domain-containing protein